MGRSLTIVLAAWAGVCMALSGGAATARKTPSGALAAATSKTVGVITHDAVRTAPGYTLLAPKHNGNTYLLDNYGQVIRSWTSLYEPGQSAYLLEDGHMIRAAMLRSSGSLGTGGGEGGRLEEYDWDGVMVWEFDYVSSTYAIHHDFKRLPNGNVIALLVERKSQAEVLAAGFKPDLLQNDYLLPDAVVEIEPVRPKGGRIVWEWHVWDHLIQSYDATKANYGRPAEHPELVDPNASPRKIPAFWNHMNSIDYNAELDQILLSVRGNSEVWVIDHSTTKSEAAGHVGGRSGKGGDLLYRWGNPQMYGAGKAADQKLFEQHDAQWIEAGRSGAGHMLVFNNGVNRPGGNLSSTDEFAVPLDSYGGYERSGSTAYAPSQLDWTYAELKGSGWYESDISGAYRLGNGNTLICYGTHGVLVEVTAGKEIVWQYVNPVVPTGVMKQGEVSGLDDRGHNLNAVFRFRRYSPDYAGLAGRDLTPQGPLAEGDEAGTVTPVSPAGPLPDSVSVEEIASGLKFSEGPVWNDAGYLLFSDVEASRVYRWSAAAGLQVESETLGQPNGLGLDLLGRLIVAEQGGRGVVRINGDGSRTVLATHYQGARLNSPNDVAIKSDGTVYFSDPTYGIAAGEQELPYAGVYRLSAGSTEPELLTAELTRPNGLVFSPDESTLYVADSDSRKVFAYRVGLDGTLESGSELLTMPSADEPDGLEVDRQGNLYVAGAVGRVWVFSAQGQALGSLSVPQKTRNLAWGDTDRRTLFIASGASVYKARLNVAGVRAPRLLSLAGGEYEMGDHQGLGGLEHGNDEIPVHTVAINPVYAGITEVTNREYVAFLNAGAALGTLSVRDGLVYAADSDAVVTDTRLAVSHSPYGWDGARFSVLDNRLDHPATGIRWEGAALYANWLSERNGWAGCYDPVTWVLDFSHPCFRLPSEAEWEYAGRGGRYAPYLTYPAGDAVDYLKANLPGSGDPFEGGDLPLTTPVAFFDGSLHTKTGSLWPAAVESYATSDGANGFGLFDMAGNVWEWTNDWYGRDYYAVSPKNNPQGPATGSPMPDGKPYRVLRGGSWYNGPDGHSRVSNRNPAYYRGPDDPNHAWYHIGFRLFASPGDAR